MSFLGTPAQAADHARRAAREIRNSEWVERAARLGYATKGIVYALIGGLAAAWAIGAGGTIAGSEGAFRTIMRQPFGRILLALVGVGLGAYAVWRFIQAAVDADRKGNDARGLWIRAGYAVSGVVHAALAAGAVAMAVGYARSERSGDSEAQDWTATLMSQPFGRWLVGLLGAGIGAFALYQLYRAWADRLDTRLDLSNLGAAARRWANATARAGLAARGVVFAIIGVFFVIAAVQADPGRARGLGGALRALEGQPYGPWLLGVVSLGLIAYGLYMALLAWRRRFGTV